MASDASAIIRYTKSVVYLDDGEMAVCKSGGYEIRSLDNLPIEKEPTEIEWSAEDAQKGGHAHFMLKEMLEQPEVVKNSIRGRLNPEEGTAVLEVCAMSLIVYAT